MQKKKIWAPEIPKGKCQHAVKKDRSGAQTRQGNHTKVSREIQTKNENSVTPAIFFWKLRKGLQVSLFPRKGHRGNKRSRMEAWARPSARKLEKKLFREGAYSPHYSRTCSKSWYPRQVLSRQRSILGGLSFVNAQPQRNRWGRDASDPKRTVHASG